MAVIIPVVSKFDDKGLKQAQSSFGKLGSSLKGVLGAAGIGVGLSSIVAGLKQSTVAAIGDAKSQALLANQLRNTIGASDAQISSVETSIAAMQKQAAVADDVIRPAFASLVRATGDVSRATSLTSLALDVAAGTGKDLGAVSLALGKYLNGSKKSLELMVPSIKGASDPMGELAKQFAGAASAAAKNDPIQRLNILFGEMQEQIGTALLPSLEAFADWMSSPSGTQLINGLVASFENIVSEATLAADGVGYLGEQLTSAFDGVSLSDEVNKTAEGIALIGTNAISAFTPVTGLLKILQLIGLAANGTKPSTAGTDETARLVRRRLESLGAITPTGATKPTTKSQSAADAAAKAAATRAAKARQAIIDAAKEAADKAQKAFEKVRDTALEFSDSFKEVAKSFTDTFKATAELGVFEQQTVDAFDAIKQSAIDASKAGLFDAKALDGLLAYADREKTLLQGIAKQRDVLAKKISIAQAITSGVMGSLNITSMLETQTQTVTQSVTKMVDGIALTTTKTFDEVISGGLADSFKKLVDKTKTFASNLTKLKALGLNGNLFKQIVEAGAEGGNATAEAIIAGGASSVTELNSLFTQLSDAGNDIAKTSTDVMYSIGEEMTNGFIEGLRSEDQKLADAATALAGIFTSTFKAQIDSAIAGTVALAASETVSSKMKLDLATRPDPNASPQRYAAWLQNIGGIDPLRSPQSYAAQQNALMGNTYNVTVNAGAIADKASLPQMVVDALNTASKQGLSTSILRAMSV